jgi:predicted AAA+ superfamily ATPase
MQKAAVEKVNSLNFKEFNLRQTFNDKRNLSCVLVGKRRIGKTYLLNHLLYSIKDWYSKVYIFSETLDLQPESFDYAYSGQKYDRFDEDVLEEIWENQKNYVLEEMKKGEKKENLVNFTQPEGI